MHRGLNKHDTFSLAINEYVNIIDYQIILMLYQPLIGNLASSLYMTLLQEKELTKRSNLQFNHYRLMLILNISEIELLDNFKILESYQLINTYYHPLKSTYIYEIIAPLHPELFFLDEKLSALLKSQLGPLHYERQRYYFLKNNPVISNEFINISKKTSTLPLTQTINDEDNPKSTINDSLKTIFNSLNINKKALPNNISANGKVTNYQQTARANLVTREQKTVAMQKNHHFNELFEQKINTMKTKAPLEYVNDLTKQPLNSRISNTLSILKGKYQLNNEVINCLIEYVWFKNDKRLEPNYIIKIAQTFNDHDINNINDSLKHLQKAYSKSKNRHFNNDAYHQDMLWSNDNLNLQKQSKKTTNLLMSQEEIDKILKEFDEQ